MNNDQPNTSPRGSDQSPGWNRRTYATWFLIAINLLVWIAMEANGGSEDPEVLLNFGAMFGPFIAGGEYWRLFTPMFLHIGKMHLIFNGLGLLIFGNIAERIFGLYRFVILYLLAGLAGSFASFAFNDAVVGAGASGAIMGILGAVAAFYFIRRNTLGEGERQNFKGLLIIAGFNIILGFTIQGIDNWAHMGGLAGGFVIGMVLAPNYQRVSGGILGSSFRIVDTNSLYKRWWVVPLALVVLVVGVRMATALASDETQAHSHVMQAERLLDEQQYMEALDEISIAFGLDGLSGYAYYVRGKIMAEQGNTPQAIRDFGSSLRLGLDSETRIDAIGTMINLRSGRRGH